MCLPSTCRAPAGRTTEGILFCLHLGLDRRLKSIRKINVLHNRVGEMDREYILQEPVAGVHGGCRGLRRVPAQRADDGRGLPGGETENQHIKEK